MFNYASTNGMLDLKFCLLRNEKESIDAIDFKICNIKKYCLHLLIHFFHLSSGIEVFQNLFDFQVCTNKIKCKSKTCSLLDFKRENGVRTLRSN